MLTRLLCLSSLFLSRLVLSAACCGGGAQSGVVITGDETYAVTLSQSYLSAEGKTASMGKMSLLGDRENTQNTFIGFSKILNEQLQFSVSTGLSLNSQDFFGVKDSQLSLSYSLIKNYLYSKYRPEIYLTAVVVFPTGASFFETRDEFTDDSLYKVAASILTLKSYQKLDYFFKFEYSYSFERRFTKDLEFKKGALLSSQFGVGFSPSLDPNLRVGFNQSFIYSSPNILKSSKTQESLAVLNFPVTLNAAYMLSDSWSLALAYTDNSLFKSQNAEVSQALSLTLNFRNYL